MADRYSAKVGESFTLDANFYVSDVLTDVFEVVKVELQDFTFNVLETITDITAVSTGVYRVTVAVREVGGLHWDVWFYKPIDGGATVSRTLEVTIADFTAAPGETVPAPTNLASNLLCEVTATFLDARGEPLQGVLVRFSPSPELIGRTSSGFAASPVTAQSDATGAFSLKLIRGLTGMISVTGLGLVRQVTIPDEDDIDLFDLTSDADDPLQVQNVDGFIDLPRRSF